MIVEPKYKVHDTILWYCDTDDEIHNAEVLFVNHAGVGYPDINYEVKTKCCGEIRVLFINEDEIIDPSLI